MDDKEKHAADFSGLQVAFGKVRRVHCGMFKCVNIGGSHRFLPDNRSIGLAQNLGAKHLSYAPRFCDGGLVCRGIARLGSVLRRRVSTVGILNEHSACVTLILLAARSCNTLIRSISVRLIAITVIGPNILAIRSPCSVAL